VSRIDRDRITRALAEAEDGTTGRIAVRVIPDQSVNAFERARHEFVRCRLHRHEPANAALILVAPRARRFAVIGDHALHQRVGNVFWESIVQESRQYFARGEVSEGVIHAIERIGEVLHGHFPEVDQEPAP
jgi:uncharacterized membrane protein